MDTSATPPTPSLTAVVRTQRVIVWGAAAAVTALAWLELLSDMRGAGIPLSWEVAGHQHAHFSFGPALGMWLLMMAAMMTPAVLPWLVTFASLTATPGHAGGWWRRALSFALGYFAVWCGYGVVGALAQGALQRLGVLDPAHGARRPVAAGILLCAGVLQFLPFRRSCLKHCRNPLSYLLARWNNGPPDGFRLGLEHGAFCVGCCWALMATGLAVGTMNLAWMAMLTMLIAAEQTLPQGERVGQLTGAALVAWGIGLYLRS